MFIGIDLGTSAVKTVLVDERQRVIASASAPLRPVTPRPGWSEDDPDSWWDAVDQTMLSLRTDNAAWLEGVQAIGLSGQMHPCLLLDVHDRAVRPAILWNDGRSAAEAARLMVEAPDLVGRLGVPAAAGFTGPKIAWLRRHEPHVLTRAATLLGAKDLLRLRMTGERLTDPSDAAGSWLLDQAAREWSPDAVAACGVNPDWLPPLVEADRVAGRLRPAVAERWGLGPACRSPAAAATRQWAELGSERSRPATASCRSALRLRCSRPTTATRPFPRASSTRSAMPRRSANTRWLPC